MSNQNTKDDPATSSAHNQSTPSSSTKNEDTSSNHRRRRGVGIVTPNACTECRKKRAKCDGNTPCGRCEANSTQCIYEVPVRQSKDMMRAEIEQLQTHRRQAERLVSSLTSSHKVDETLNRLRNGQSLEAVSEWLEDEASQSQGTSGKVTEYSSPGQETAVNKASRKAKNIVPKIEPESWSAWTSESSQSRGPQSVANSQGEDGMNWQTENSERDASAELTCPLVPTHSAGPNPTETEVARGRGQNHILGPTYGIDQRIEDASVWTTVTNNTGLIEHLMALYFCWEYPTFASLSKEHFLTDFRSGRPRFCSQLLVNSMLALGCRFSKLPESRSNPDDPQTSGDHFYAEARRLLMEDDHKSLTTVQALGLMSIREASCGRDTESFYLAGQAIRLSVEFGLHIEAAGEKDAAGGIDHEVRAATFWGAFALDAAWSLTIGRIPHMSRNASLVAKPAIIDQIESSQWVPYTDDGIPLQRSASQPSNVRSVFRCFAELSELVHQSLYTLYTPGRAVHSNEIVSMYFRYLNWYSALPEALRLGHNFTPAVLFSHMYYHFAILLILRPFVKLRFIGSGVSPRDVCAQAADAITTLIHSYNRLYTLQRTPSFVPYIALAGSIMHLVVGAISIPAASPDPRKQILQSAKDLKHMCDCHGFARRALDIVRLLANTWNLSSTDAPAPTETPDSPFVQLTLNLALGSPAADERGDPSDPNNQGTTISIDDLKWNCRSSSKSQNMFCPNFGEALPDKGPTSELALFSPFPMQGLPLLSGEGEDELEGDGFARLAPRELERGARAESGSVSGGDEMVLT